MKPHRKRPKSARPKKPPRKRDPVPLWTWASGITQSALSQFTNCPEQFSLNYVEGWTPRSFSAPLEFGSVFHLCLQAQGLKATRSLSPEKIAQDVTKTYEANRRPLLKSPEDGQALSKCLAQIEAVFPLYYRHYQQDDRKQTWTAREKKFQLEHTFDRQEPWVGQTRLPVKIKVLLRGMRDGDYQLRVGGKLRRGLFETKTKSELNDLEIQSGLRADLQTMFYLYAMKLEYGEYPCEVLYNCVRRPGLVYNPNKENLKDYKDRIQRDIQDRPQWYFKRWEVTVLPEDIDTFVATTLDPILRLMYFWWESVSDRPFDRFLSPYHYRSLTALYTKYGRAPLYNLMILGRQAEYYRRSSIFPELEESGQAA
jgi:hypothetical protein